MLKLLGPAVSMALCAAAFMLALDSIAGYGTANAISIAAAAVALTAMSQCLVLAARFRILEPVFGGSIARTARINTWESRPWS